MAQLAIKGHETRGSEVIEILSALGGLNTFNYGCITKDDFYYIGNSGIICKSSMQHNRMAFTLEEFLEKYPYKVGDRVNSKCLRNYKIDAMEWESINNRIIYKLQGMGWYSAKELQPYTEQKEETMEENKTPKTQAEVNKYLLDNPVKNPANLWDIEQVLQNDGLKLPEDVRVNSSGIGCIAFTKWYEKSQYPKTYEECCEVLFPSSIELGKVLTSGYNCELLKKLGELLICRDAYWKIAGEQMGLEKPWEPDWLDTNTQKYCIYYVGNEIKKQPMLEVRHFLTFPTAEMRDAFCEYFKNSIEICKELL